MLDFVYIYRHERADSDELRWSIRSVYEHCQDKFRIIIAGDRPPWFGGICLDIKPVEGSRWYDATNKLLVAANHPLVGEELVVMMDDIIFTHDVDGDFLRTPRCEPFKKFSKHDNEWSYRCKSTNVIFTDPKDYAIHYPHVFRKENVIELDKAHNLRSGRWEVANLYGNTFFKDPKPAKDVHLYYGKPVEKVEDLDVVVSGKSTFTYGQRVWGPVLRSWLKKRFPHRCELEVIGDENGSAGRAELVAKMLERKNLTSEIPSYLECEHRGEILTKVYGKNCGYKHKEQDIYFCDMFGRCSIGTIGNPGIVGCNSCQVTLAKLEI